MKNKIKITFLALLFHLVTNSQVFVSPNAYVFVNNQFVYITQNITLDSNGNFYLRNQSQLLQGTNGTGTNSGLGNLSIFQEGTVNNFQYNYWCSPVGIPSNTNSNSNFGITRIFRPTGLTTSSSATILPFNNLNGVANPLSIAQRWIYTFSNSNSYSQWNYIGSSNSISTGLGFTMKGTSGIDNFVADSNEGIQNNIGNKQRYDFRGKPNDGTITNLVSTNNFTLIGNPYPSAIDLDAFLLDPSNASVINGQAYFWEQVAVNSHYVDAYSGGYGTYTPGAGYTPAAFWNFNISGDYEYNLGMTGTYFERKFTPVGQGFMVRGTANGSVSMRNSFRVYRKEGVTFNSEFARNNNQITNEFFEDIPNLAGKDYTQVKKGYVPQVRINAMYNNRGIRPTTLGFDPNTTDAFDYGFDGQSPSVESAEFYYILNNSSNEFVTNVTAFDENKRIPIGFRCLEQTNFKLKVVDILYGFDTNQNIYIHDKENDIYYDIKNGIFDVTLPPGNNKTRFEITFKNNDVLSNTDHEINNVDIYQNNNDDILTIFNKLNTDIEQFELYDVSGKLVLEKRELGTQSHIQISTTNLSDGIYIASIKTNEGISFKKKISIN